MITPEEVENRLLESLFLSSPGTDAERSALSALARFYEARGRAAQ